MPLVGLFVDDSAVSADFQGLAAMTLVWREEFDAIVAASVVVSVAEQCHPPAGLLSTGEWLSS